MTHLGEKKDLYTRILTCLLDEKLVKILAMKSLGIFSMITDTPKHRNTEMPPVTAVKSLSNCKTVILQLLYCFQGRKLLQL